MGRPARIAIALGLAMAAALAGSTGSGEAPEPTGPKEDSAVIPLAPAVASYTLRAKLDPEAHTVTGEGTITWKNASSSPQKELYVHLYLNGFKNERTVLLRDDFQGLRGTGTPATWGHIAVRRFFVKEMEVDAWPLADKTSPDDPDDETDIRVPLPRAVSPGETITIDMAWEAKLPTIVIRTGYSGRFHMVAQWFPKIARLEPDGTFAHFTFDRMSEFYADFGAYDVTVDAPRSFVVGGVGKLASERIEGERKLSRFVQRDVHDFAFTAWDRFEEKRDAAGGVAIRCLYPPGFERAAEHQIEAVKFGLAYFGNAYGAYPYETLTLVHPPEGAGEAGGMEYPTLITTGGAWYSPWMPGRFLEGVTIHELGHQWFYGLVASNEHAFPFLDEGLNSYAELDALEARHPRSSLATLPGVSLGMPEVYRIFATEAQHRTPVAASSDEFATGQDYAYLVYMRTATVLLTLGRVYGEDVVRSAIGHYTRTYRFAHPGPEEFIAVIRERVGEGAAKALRAALFEKAWVDYSVESFSSARERAPRGIFGDPAKPEERPSEGVGFRGEVVVRRRGTLVFPVDVAFIPKHGKPVRVRWDGEEEVARLPYHGDSELVAVVVDPDRRVLLDANFLDNAKRVRGIGFSGKVLDRALFLAETMLSSVVP